MKRMLATLVAVFMVPVMAAGQAPPPAATGEVGPAAFEMAQQGEQHGRMPGPPGGDLGAWWKNSEIVRELGITPAQVTQIEDKFLEHRLKLIDMRAELERQETKLQPLIEADQPDEAKVGAQIDLVLAARGKLEKANAMMMLAIRRVLSVEQWKKLEAIKHERERRHEYWETRPAPPAAPGWGHEPAEPRPPAPARPPGSTRPPETNQD